MFVCCVLLEDHDTQRVYRRFDFSKAQLIRPGAAYGVTGKVNSIDKLYLVTEPVRLDTKYARSSSAPDPVDSVGGLPLLLKVLFVDPHPPLHAHVLRLPIATGHRL